MSLTRPSIKPVPAAAPFVLFAGWNFDREMRGASRINLHRSVAESVPVDININSTDEEVVRFLNGRRAGDSTPQNVITDVNLFDVEPWNLPDGLVGEDVDHMLPNLVGQEERELTSRNCSHNSQTVAEKDQGESALSRNRPNEPVSVIFSENPYDDFVDGEYLELNDLSSPDTHASSDDSSIMSINSDEFFDSDALLTNIGNDHGFGIQERTNYDFNISAPVRSNQVLIVPSPPGPIITNDGLVIQESNSSSRLDRTEPTSNQQLTLPSDERQIVKASTSSKDRSSHTSKGDVSNSVRKIAKMGKRYCCFASF